MRILVALLIFMVSVVNAAPGEICSLAKTRNFTACRDAVEQWARDQQEAAKSTAIEDRAETLAKKNTGEASALAGGATSINDFLPLLAAVIDTGGLGSDGERLGFEWTNPLNLPTQQKNKLTVSAGKSNLFAPLETALNDASLQDLASELKDGLNEGDDVSVGFSYSVSSPSFGRDHEQHATLFSALMERAISNAKEDDDLRRVASVRIAQMDDQIVAVEKKRNVKPEDAFNGLEDDFSRLPAEGTPEQVAKTQEEYIQAVEAEQRANRAAVAAIRTSLENVGFYDLVNLINNQRQLSFTADYRARDEFVGPDEFRAVVTYEMGWNNVDTFREYQSSSCAQPKIDEGQCLADFIPTVRNDLHSSPRITFNAEYIKRNRLDVAIPTSSFIFALEPQESFKLSATYGRYLGKENEGRTRARVEASASYEDVSDDPLRQSRGLASATLTYPVGNGLYLSLGAVYATKPEFRGNVDEELSARAGITYKVINEAN